MIQAFLEFVGRTFIDILTWAYIIGLIGSIIEGVFRWAFLKSRSF